jgi:arylformamidase
MASLVYGKYDQESLDLQYDMRRVCPHFADTLGALEKVGERVSRDYDCHLDVPFGETPLQTVDVYPGGPGSPVHLFIHGGYWKAFDKKMFRALAEPFIKRGVTFVLNNYDLCPNVTMDEIARQNQAALEWIYANIGDYGADRNRIYVSGHSAGGHLTAMLVATDWKTRGLPADLIKGSTPISGLFDLEPLRRAYLNADLHMDEEMTRRNSPIHSVPDVAAPMVIAVGGGETDEFRRQSRIYYDAAKAKGLDCDYLEVGKLDHVFVGGALADPDSPLTRAVFRQMGVD